MYLPKRYGESKIASCPFCGRQAYAKNKEGIPVCSDHKDASFGIMKCICGSTLDMREGKWGPFFICDKCGIVNMKKAMEMNPKFASSASAAPLPYKVQGKKTDAAETKPHPMMGDKRAERANAYKNPDGSDKFVRSDDPRFEFK